MKKIYTYILAGLCGIAVLSCDEKNEAQGLPSTMADVEITGDLPYIEFYGENLKSSIMDYESEAGRMYSIEHSTNESLVFTSMNTDFTEIKYNFRSLRQYISSELTSEDNTKVWNKQFIALLEDNGFKLSATESQQVTLVSERKAVLATVTPDKAVFTPTEALPELPALETKLIHPYHNIGATLAELGAAEEAAGRTLLESGTKNLYISMAPSSSMFDRFGFWFDENGRLYKTMSILKDGSYLDTDAFITEMEAEGFVFEKRTSENYRIFTDLAKTVHVRSANLPPTPTIEYEAYGTYNE